MFSFSQNEEIDSLQQQLKIQKNTDKKIEIYIQLFDKKYIKIKEKDSAFMHLKLAEKLINSNTSDSLKALINIGKVQYFLNKDKYDSVLYYTEKALNYRKAIGTNKLITLYSDLGLANYHKLDYKKAIEMHFKALKICDSLQQEQKKSRVLNNIGITYIKLRDWDNAEAYMNKSLDLCKKFNIQRGIVYTLGNLGIIYKNQNKLDKAISSYLESITVSESLNDKVAIVRNYLNLGGLYESKKEYDNALDVYNKALSMTNEINKKVLEASLLLGKANVYSKQRKYSLADKNYKKCLQISQEEEFLDVLSETHLGLAESYESRGNYKQAITERKLFEKWKDSIISKEHLSDISELEIRYESEKKDKAIITQKLELKEQGASLQKKQSQYQLMIGLSGFLLLTSMLLWFLHQQRQKRKNQEILTLKREQQVQTLESLIEGEEKERFRIAKELHDGVNVDLSAIKYKLTSILEKNNEVINEAVKMIDKSCEQVRAISHNLVPPALKDFSLIEALQDYCSTTNTIHKAEVSFQSIGKPITLSKKAEANIFRIVQELVNNSVKHAEASEIDVQISYQNDSIQLTIEDNGKGFDLNAIKGSGIGLQNIKSRVTYLNAKLDMTSDGNGTSSLIDINTKEVT